METRCLNEIMRLRIEMMERENNLREALRAEFRAAIQQNKTDLQAQIRQSNTELREVIQQNKTDLLALIFQNKTDFQTQILQNNTEIRASRIMHRAPQIITGPSNYTNVKFIKIKKDLFIFLHQ